MTVVALFSVSDSVVYYCRVYVGNKQGEQSESFTNAFSKVKKFLNNAGHDITLEVRGLKCIREDKWTVKALVDWLLGSHIHFVITHPHQGLESMRSCSVVDIYKEFARLKYHPGFPSGQQLKCPIFSQDKFNYLQHIPATMPTCKLVVEEVEEGMERSFNYEDMFPETIAKIRR